MVIEIDFEILHSFIVVAREKSISKASQLLHVTQPTLSTRIRKLEEELGFELLDRTWEGVSLTNQGQYFLSIVIQSMQDLNATTKILMKREPEHLNATLQELLSKDRLVIGIEVILVPLVVDHIMSELCVNFPNIDCRYISRPWRSLLDLLENGGVDLAIFLYDDNIPVSYSTPLIEDEVVLLCSSKEFPHIEEDLSNISILKDEPFVLFDRYALDIYNIIKNICMDAFGHFPERIHIVDEMTTMMSLLATGNCYTIMPSLSVMPLLGQTQSLQVIRMNDKSIKTQIHMAFSDSNPMSGPLKHLQRSLTLYMNSIRDIKQF